jgi:hypothetical protein
MDASEQAYYLRLTLQEEDAARNATSVEARRRHEELAIAYEMRCLLGVPSDSANSLASVGAGR